MQPVYSILHILRGKAVLLCTFSLCLYLQHAIGNPRHDIRKHLPFQQAAYLLKIPQRGKRRIKGNPIKIVFPQYIHVLRIEILLQAFRQLIFQAAHLIFFHILWNHGQKQFGICMPIRYLSLYFLQYEFCPLYRLHRRGRDKKLMDPKVKQERRGKFRDPGP